MSEMVAPPKRAVDAEHSGSFSVIGREHHRDHLRLVAESFRKQRATGRSIMRLVRISLSVGLPSRLINPPGILPAGVGVLAIIHGEREEVMRSVGSRRETGSRQDN